MRTEIEFKEILRKEKEDYDKACEEFYTDPLHWSNNKRRLCGLFALRGEVNKNRRKKYRSFRPSPIVFSMVESLIEDIFESNLNNKWFGDFVDIKSVKGGDEIFFEVDE